MSFMSIRKQRATLPFTRQRPERYIFYEFTPKIRGAGVLSECAADISTGPPLFEVKTAESKIARKDIRQLIVYLALQAATGRDIDLEEASSTRRGQFIMNLGLTRSSSV